MSHTEHPPAGPTATDRQHWLDRQRRHVEVDRPTGLFRRGAIGTSAAVSWHTAGWEQRHWTSRLLHRAGDVASRSSMGIGAACLVVGWTVVGVITAFPSWWQATLFSVTGSVTFVMVFVIQHTQERQTSATQRKLDELIRSSAHADDALIAVEGAPDEQLQALAHLNLADRDRAAAKHAEADS